MELVWYWPEILQDGGAEGDNPPDGSGSTATTGTTLPSVLTINASDGEYCSNLCLSVVLFFFSCCLAVCFFFLRR